MGRGKKLPAKHTGRIYAIADVCQYLHDQTGFADAGSALEQGHFLKGDERAPEPICLSRSNIVVGFQANHGGHPLIEIIGITVRSQMPFFICCKMKNGKSLTPQEFCRLIFHFAHFCNLWGSAIIFAGRAPIHPVLYPTAHHFLYIESGHHRQRIFLLRRHIPHEKTSRCPY